MWVTHAYADAIASNPRLRHFEQGTTDLIAIADADFVIGKAFHGQVLAKLTVFKVTTLKVGFPMVIGVKLIHHHRAVLSAVS
jgi:hypothetical protein